MKEKYEGFEEKLGETEENEQMTMKLIGSNHVLLTFFPFMHKWQKNKNKIFIYIILLSNVNLILILEKLDLKSDTTISEVFSTFRSNFISLFAKLVEGGNAVVKLVKLQKKGGGMFR